MGNLGRNPLIQWSHAHLHEEIWEEWFNGPGKKEGKRIGSKTRRK